MASDVEFLKVAWSAKKPRRCRGCKWYNPDYDMHPCSNGDWTARCSYCYELLYRVTRERVIYWPELKHYQPK